MNVSLENSFWSVKLIVFAKVSSSFCQSNGGDKPRSYRRSCSGDPCGRFSGKWNLFIKKSLVLLACKK
jgi:hypothetical protein